LAFAELIKLARDESGATMVENTLTITLFLTILFGMIDFSYLFYQYNAATKAVQQGARIAAVSDPVATGIRNYTGLTGGLQPGQPLPANAYASVCTANANASTVTCTGTFATGSSAAFRRIVFGEQSRTACAASPSQLTVGMCNMFSRLQANNVEIRYTYTGLGYAGRPGGAVPTITVSLRQGQNGVPFQFIMVGALANLASVTIPSLATTVTGEDLNVLKPI
jgi:Flp pilus assembly protein TadG